MKIDLHTHSSCSDGTLTPSELIALADNEGVECIALCDHDTTDGIEEFRSAAKTKAIFGIGGVELSVSWSNGTCHIIGLNFDIQNKALEYTLRTFRVARDKRNHEIITKLNDLGIDIDFDTVQRRSFGKVIGRPHIASVLIEKGVSKSMHEAFELYLRKGAKAYVPRYQIDPVSAICVLKKAGAITIVAHPAQLNISDEQCRIVLKQLKDYGLDALEVYTPHHSVERVHAYLNLAHELKLGVSGGSDFHGKFKPDRQLGMYSSDKQIPCSVRSILEPPQS